MTNKNCFQKKSSKMSALYTGKIEIESWIIYQYIINNDCANCFFMNDGGVMFRARDVGLRAQKKILSRMGSNKNVTRAFIDDNTSSLLDNLYRIIKLFTKNRKEAEKIIKNIIKIVIKIGVLIRNQQLSIDELKLCDKFNKKIQIVQMSIISFYEVDYSYDKQFLKTALMQSRDTLRSVIEKHLTDKTLDRYDSIFHFFARDQFLDAIFNPSLLDYREIMKRLVLDLNKSLESNSMQL